jgi:NDP-sugar dehydratase or epimerase
MKRIVLFGATGAVGTYTAIELKKRGYNIIAVGRRSSDNGFFAEHGIEYYSVDITCPDDFRKLPLDDIYCVIHFAGILPAAMKGYYPHKYIDTVLGGTLNVLNYCLTTKAEKIIFSQSRADSNYLMDQGPIPSDIVKKFPLTGDHSVYSICKNAAVDLIEHYYYQYGLKRFILRFPTIYAYHPNPYFYVNGIRKWKAYRYLIEQAIKGETIEIWGDPMRAKEIVYVKDAIQIVEKCLESNLDGGMYNVGRGIPVTLKEQILGIVEIFSSEERPSAIVYRPDKPNARDYVNDISKTCRELGYKPEYDYKTLLIDYKKEMLAESFKKLWGSSADYE